MLKIKEVRINPNAEILKLQKEAEKMNDKLTILIF